MEDEREKRCPNVYVTFPLGNTLLNTGPSERNVRALMAFHITFVIAYMISENIGRTPKIEELVNSRTLFDFVAKDRKAPNVVSR